LVAVKSSFPDVLAKLSYRDGSFDHLVGGRNPPHGFSACAHLDAPHLASIEFLRALRQQVLLSSYEERLLAAARTWQIPFC
jgi:hypothetical protein